MLGVFLDELERLANLESGVPGRITLPFATEKVTKLSNGDVAQALLLLDSRKQRVPNTSVAASEELRRLLVFRRRSVRGAPANSVQPEDMPNE